MADPNQVAINITAQNQSGPAFQAIAQALTQLGQQASQTTIFLAQIATALSQVQQAQTANTGSTNQLAQAITQQTQAYTQANAALLAHQQQQAAAAQAAQAAAQQVQAAAQQARAAGAIWQQAFAVGAGLGIATGIQQIVSQLANSAKEAVNTAVKFEQLRMSTAAVTGSQVEGARALAFTRDLAQRLGVNMLSLTDAYKNFAAATRGTNLEGEGTRRVFEQVITAGRVMGASNDQIRHGLLALEQMVSKGTVSMEELRRQLGNALPGAFQIAARAMGVSTEELERMVRTGEVKAIPFLTKLGQQLEKEFGGKAKDAADTAGAAFERFANNMRDISASAGNAILTILKPFVDFLNKGFELYDKARAQAERERQQREAPFEPSARLPRGMPVPADIAARQKQIDDLARGGMPLPLDPMTGGLSGLPYGLPRDQDAQLRKLKEEQDKAVKAWLDQLSHPPEEMGASGSGELETPRGAPDFATIGRNAVRLRKQLTEDMTKQAGFGTLAPGTLDSQIDAAKEQQKLAQKAIEELGKQLPVNQQTGMYIAPQETIAILKEMVELRDKEAEAIQRLEALKDNAAADAKARDQAEEDRIHARESVYKRSVDAQRDADKEAAEEAAALLKARGDEEKRLLDAEAKGIEAIDDARAKAYQKRLNEQKAYGEALDKLLAQLGVRKEDRRLAGMGADMPEGTPEELAPLLNKYETARAKQAEREQADRAKRLFTTIGGELQGAFDSVWSTIFSIGEEHAEGFGVTMLRILQRSVEQISLQLFHQLLNTLVPPDKEGNNIWGQVAKGIVSVVGGAFSGSAGGGSAGTWDVNWGANAQGGIIPAISTLRALPMANGGIVSRPSFATLAERPGLVEAVVPLPNGRAIPVDMRGGSQAQPQPTVVELHLDFSNALDPRSIRTSKAEVHRWVIEGVQGDTAVRRVIMQQAR